MKRLLKWKSTQTGFTENKQLIVPFLVRGFRDGLIVEATFGNTA
jgi:hypothetical protein